MVSVKRYSSNLTIPLFVIAILLASGCTSSKSDEISEGIGDLLSIGVDKEMTKQELAVATGNPEICHEATHVDVCLMAVAKSENDITICDDIVDSGMKSQCVNDIRNAAAGIGDADCGGDKEPCCPGDFCDYGHECRVDMLCHVLCGQLEYPCCDGSWCNTEENLKCNNYNKCVVCGELDAPCCDGSKCNDDHMQCYLGYCRDPAELYKYELE